MVFKFSYANGMDQEADEWKAFENGSRHVADDHRNKRAALPLKEKFKVVVEPKAVQASNDDFAIGKRSNHGHRDRDASIAPTPPGVSDVPPAKTGAMIHTQANNQDNITQIQAGKSVQILSDDENKELSHKFESWSRTLNINLKGKNKIVLKTELHCEGCIKKIRHELKKLEGIEAMAFDTGRDLVAVIGTVDEEKLVWYIEQKFKQKVVVVLLEKTNNGEKATMSLSSPDVNAGSGGEKAPNRDDMDEPVADEAVDVEKKPQEDHTKDGPASNKPCSVNRVTSEPLMPVYEKDVDGIARDKNNAGWSSLLTNWNKGMPETDKQGGSMDECLMHRIKNHGMFNDRDHGIFDDENPDIACSIM